MRVLVTDGDERAALAVTRSCGRRHQVVVVSVSGRSLAGASRFAAREFAAPSPLRSGLAFALRVADVVRRSACDVVLPIGEASLLALLAERERLAPAMVPFPPVETVRAVCDKPWLLEQARRLGIAVPHQRRVDSPEELAAAARELDGPVVVKPARSVAEDERGAVKLAVRHASDARELRAVAKGLPHAAYPLLLQQRIVGPGIGVFLLPWGGRLRAAFAHRRLRERPPAGGVSVLSESVALDPELLRLSACLLEAVGWEGVAMVEYKRDAASGTPYLMEVNGRFWGSLQLAVDAGVDFPAVLLDCAQGAPPVRPAPYRAGQRLRWFWGDVDHLLARLRTGAAALHLPPGAPSRPQAVADFLAATWHPRQRSETWRLGDPAPFLRETRDWLRGGPPAPAA